MKKYNFVTTDKISKRMSHVRPKGGKAEVLLAKSLWHEGIRYRKNLKTLYGSPDIAITKSKIAIFVDGEFWHGFDWSHRKSQLHSNKEYWIQKIEENIKRDKHNDQLLIASGWNVIHFWEKEVLHDLPACIAKIKFTITNKQRKR
jgi:DNA mismatch endonuclease Vsr